MPACCPHKTGALGCLLGVHTDLEHLDACLLSTQDWSTWMPAWCPHRSGVPGCLLGVLTGLEYLDTCLLSTQDWSTWMPAWCPHRSGVPGCLLAVHTGLVKCHRAGGAHQNWMLGHLVASKSSTPDLLIAISKPVRAAMK